MLKLQYPEKQANSSIVHETEWEELNITHLSQ
jgi:hypothetical protein